MFFHKLVDPNAAPAQPGKIFNFLSAVGRAVDSCIPAHEPIFHRRTDKPNNHGGLIFHKRVDKPDNR